MNLSAREGRDRIVPWAPGTTEDVTFEVSPLAFEEPEQSEPHGVAYPAPRPIGEDDPLSVHRGLLVRK